MNNSIFVFIIVLCFASCEYSGALLYKINSDLKVVQSIDCDCPVLIQDIGSAHAERILFRNVNHIVGKEDRFKLCHMRKDTEACFVLSYNPANDDYIIKNYDRSEASINDPDFDRKFILPTRK